MTRFEELADQWQTEQKEFFSDTVVEIVGEFYSWLKSKGYICECD